VVEARRNSIWGTCTRGLIGAAALCATALTLAFQFCTAQTWWIELLRYVPYPAWLLPALLGLALSLLQSWRWRLLAAASVALVIGPVMGLSLGLDKVDNPGARSQTLRVMTYNAKTFRAEQIEGVYEALGDEIARQSPDVLLMQDAQHLNRPGRPIHPALQAALVGYQLRGFDQYVVASRYPLRDCKAGAMPIGKQAHPYWRCTVQVGRTALTLVTAHTLTPREGLNATRSERLEGLDDWRDNFAGRMAQARKLADDTALLPRPLILAGDLNAAEHSPVVQTLLATGLRDAHGAAGLGWGYTLGHALRLRHSFLRIDHILVSPDIGVVRAMAGGPWGSEHRPVIADVLLPQ